MPKPKTPEKIIQQIKNSRTKGMNAREIANTYQVGLGTVCKYIKGVKVSSEYYPVWEEKRFPSKTKSRSDWKVARTTARAQLSKISKRDRLFLLIGIYWGEGTKKELNLINGDPALIKIFVVCLEELGIDKSQLKVSLRVYSGQSEDEVTSFWKKLLGVSDSQFYKTERLVGTKTNKLQYGMCRIRVLKSGRYFKLLMSMLDLIRKEMLP